MYETKVEMMEESSQAGGDLAGLETGSAKSVPGAMTLFKGLEVLSRVAKGDHTLGMMARSLGLNKTNLRLLAKWYGTKASAWVGKTVTVYRDESIQFAGRLVGGWRLRKPQAHDLNGMEAEGVPF